MLAFTGASWIWSEDSPFSDLLFIDSRSSSRRLAIASLVSLSTALLHGKNCRQHPSPLAFPVSALCRNEHSGGSGFAIRRPKFARRMGSGVTICDCIPDMRSKSTPSCARACCLPEERPGIGNSCLNRSRILPRAIPLRDRAVLEQREK